MARIVYFHRNQKAGFSINKVIQTIIRGIPDKEEFYVPYLGGAPGVLLKNILFVRRHRNRQSINHITGDILYCAMGLIGCKSVLTIHDTGGMDQISSFSLNLWIRKWIWLKIPMMLATKVVCISEDTRDRLYRMTKRRDFVVIHNAVDSLFETSPKLDFPAKPSILLIGTNENKNLLRTFDAVKDLPCSLTIIGKLHEDQEKFLLDHHIEYQNKVGLSDEQVVEEYVKSDIVSFISLFEGFGMIVIEANKVGRPVICSDIDVLHEVGGDAALYVDPKDTGSMKEGFERLFIDRQLRESLVAKGYENVKRFDADTIRKQWYSLYAEIQSSS